MARIEITETQYPTGPYYSARYVGFWNMNLELGTGYSPEEAIADLERAVAEREATLKHLEETQRRWTIDR